MYVGSDIMKKLLCSEKVKNLLKRSLKKVKICLRMLNSLFIIDNVVNISENHTYKKIIMKVLKYKIRMGITDIFTLYGWSNDKLNIYRNVMEN